MLLNRAIGIHRIIYGSVLAAIIYCLLLYIPALQRISYILYALFTPVLPILYIYKPIHIKEFLKIYLVSAVVAFIIGGSTFSLWYITGYNADISSMSIGWLLTIGLSIGGIFYLTFYKIRKRFILPLFEYEVKITYRDKAVCIKSILDTGNCLYTPIGHRPVIIVSYDALKDLFTNDQRLLLDKYKNNVLELISREDFKPSYIIPFNSVGCKLGVLLGIEADQINIYRDNFEKIAEKYIIGITFNNIFYDKSYHALLHPDFILN
jgi:stage II sporulation protein GA (sporulation sigma-E factor processing peptidase)